MRRINLLAILFLSIFALTGCAARADYRVRDPYYNDYHVWNNDKVVYYNRWRVETHRPDVDYRHAPYPRSILSGTRRTLRSSRACA